MPDPREYYTDRQDRSDIDDEAFEADMLAEADATSVHELRVLYYLTEGSGPERPVTMEEWVEAERDAGFNNKYGRPDLPATAGFSAGHMSGRIEYVTGNLMPDFAWMNEQTDLRWRYIHGVGPEPAYIPPPEPPRYHVPGQPGTLTTQHADREAADGSR